MSVRFIKAYVDGDLEHATLLDVVADAVAGDIDGWTVEAGGIEIDVRPNEDARSRQRNTDPDDFIYFPFTLDIEAVDERVDLDSFLGVMSVLMHRMHSAGMRVVSACDGEAQLPGGGRLGFGPGPAAAPRGAPQELSTKRKRFDPPKHPGPPDAPDGEDESDE